VTFTPKDKFPPAVPIGLTAVPGTRTIELVWERNGERDFASYSVYRDGKRIADMLGSPAYSDKDVKPGTTYRYQVSAVDSAGNESALSGPAEAAIP
jgi:fibronectin type 3 domain-containing protein